MFVDTKSSTDFLFGARDGSYALQPTTLPDPMFRLIVMLDLGHKLSLSTKLWFAARLAWCLFCFLSVFLFLCLLPVFLSRTAI